MSTSRKDGVLVHCPHCGSDAIVLGAVVVQQDRTRIVVSRDRVITSQTTTAGASEIVVHHFCNDCNHAWKWSRTCNHGNVFTLETKPELKPDGILLLST